MRVDFMGKKERLLTPMPFARHLVAWVEAMYHVTPCVLFTCRDSPYYGLVGQDNCWDINRDAWSYDRDTPVIAHPPCGPWGMLRWNVRHQRWLDGILAMSIVHRVGGIVEQPSGSHLFAEYGDGRLIYTVDQRLFGHRARKRTLLYVV